MSKLDDLFLSAGDTGPLPGTLPVRIDTAGASEAVLLLHGYTGNPAELIPVGKALADAGYAISIPRYPGHGTCRSDFLKTDAMDWARSAFDAYMDLRARYGTVHVVGHSMGGLLAAAVAAAFAAPRLVLFAPAFITAARTSPSLPGSRPSNPSSGKATFPPNWTATTRRGGFCIPNTGRTTSSCRPPSCAARNWPPAASFRACVPASS